ncbi:putative baseplate assembly protein [Massilia horti]|uniref:Putative baseplate assembly protein n=2 Tax=Massilia horti TaxID=2562153 RepID=A0A4Y9T409_9BURK|nr:putative baseplate assembly protein [Massilia horti]
MRLLANLRPALAGDLYQAWRNTPAAKPEAAEVFVLRVRAQLFGHNAPKRMKVTQGEVTVLGDWPVARAVTAQSAAIDVREEEHAVHLDAAYEQILPNSWLVVSTPRTRLTDPASTKFFLAGNPNPTLSRAEYGMTGKTTRIELRVPDTLAAGTWFTKPPSPSDPKEYSDNYDDFNAIRRTVVYAASEKLELAEMPIGDDICGSRIELAGLYDALEAGRWLIVSGERTDIKDGLGKPVSGVVASELVMLDAVTQDVLQVQAPPAVTRAALPRIGDIALAQPLSARRAARAAAGPQQAKDASTVALAGDRVHTHLTLATGLAYKYKRDTVKIRANVVRATHGETRQEVLGSGDATQAFQSFTLKQHPLTYVSAPTPAGVASTLTVRVNQLEWHEAASLAGLGPRERSFVTRTDDDGSTSVVFGNGQSGARLPGGIENVRAEYRYGIGRPGNVKAGQVSLLATRPLGVKGVVNPLPASGGADRETRDQARKNVPLAVTALDRLVSVQDHADFARTFGGVGKAVARERSDGRRQVVHLTIAGVDDIPIAADSDVLRNLRAALHLYGDPVLPTRLQVRERLALVVSARVGLAPDYLWEATEPLLRQAMLAAFGFDNRELGRDLYASAAIAVLQAVPGVAWLDLEVFDVISEQALLNGFDEARALQLKRQDRIAVSCGELRGASLLPAQIAYLSPEVPDTLILKEASA